MDFALKNNDSFLSKWKLTYFSSIFFLFLNLIGFYFQTDCGNYNGDGSLLGQELLITKFFLLTLTGILFILPIDRMRYRKKFSFLGSSISILCGAVFIFFFWFTISQAVRTGKILPYWWNTEGNVRCAGG